MRKNLIMLIFFMLGCGFSKAQRHDPAYQKVDRWLQDYIQFSRLGPGYSREISQDIIDQFKSLFERDSFLYWDLFKSDSDSLLPPQSVVEYVERAKSTYHLQQPILDYPGMKVTFQPDGKRAIVYLKKTNQIMDNDDKPLDKNKIKLCIHIDLTRQEPRVRNIFEDKRVSFIKSISVGTNITIWSNVLSYLINKPVVVIGPNEQYREFKITGGFSFQRGAMVEMRFNRDLPDGLSFSTGIFWSKTPLSTTMRDYSYSYPDTIDQPPLNPFTCTTYERSPEVNEKIILTRIEIPFLLKSYLKKWIYLKAGTSLSYITGSTDVTYLLSRTGGGLVTDLTTQNSFYLDEAHELKQESYGYFQNKSYWFPKEKVINKVIISMQLAAGFEKRFNYLCINAEPNITFGMNPVSVRSSPDSYQLTTVKNFNSILESIQMPAFEFTIGLRLVFSYLFKN